MILNKNTKLTYLGHATVLIETPGGKRILLDPWTKGNPACPAEYKTVDSLGKLDVILFTHIHGDHIEDLEEIARANPDAKVIGMVEATDWLETQGLPNTIGMNKGGTVKVGELSFTMTHADHSSSFVQADGKVIYGGEAAGFVIVLENGFTVYASGDTALFGDMALIKQFHAPELAILCIGDHFTMGPREAAHAIRLLGVKHVLPIHYATFPILTGTPDALRQHSADIMGLQIHALKPGQTLE
jgi:L-ascorbate metabolism protein UlaG (beta-lactamase superfamily)